MSNVGGTARAAERMAELFAGSDRAHGTHGEPDPRTEAGKHAIKRTARTLRGPPTPALWRRHLAGERPLGIIPVREDNTCSWGSIDLDAYDVDLLEVVERVERSRLPLIPCVSKSGGLHLFLFLNAPEPSNKTRDALHRAAGVLNMGACEIFPKQTRLAEDAVGNWMVMPYFGGTFGGRLRLQRGLKRTGAEMTLAEFVATAERRRTTLAAFVGLVRSLETAPGAEARSDEASSSGADFADGPPCLQRLAASGAQGDGRKRTLFMMALYYKRSDKSGWKEKVDAANHRFFEPALPPDEVMGVIKSVSKKDYEYSCKEEPMRGVCDSGLCRTREFGVGGGGALPAFEKVAIYEGDETTWEITMAGKKITMSSDEMLDHRAFNKRCFAQLHRAFPPMRQKAWLAFLSETAARVTPQKPDPGTTQSAQFRELLVEFLTNRSRGQRREDLLMGRPWQDDKMGRHYFRLRDLKNFLERDRTNIFRGASLVNLGQLIRDMRGAATDITVGGRTLGVFWVPVSAVEAAPAIDPPEPPEAEADI